MPSNRYEYEEDGDFPANFEKIPRRKSHDDESMKPKNRKARRHKQISPAPTPAIVRREAASKSKDFSTFGKALYLARQVKDRSQDVHELAEVVGQLEEKEVRSLIRRLQREVLFEPEKARLPALFTVCRLARVTNPATGKKQNLLPVAATTAAVYQALHEGGATVEDLMAVGLAEIVAFKTAAGKQVARLEPKVSRERLRTAARQLRRVGRKAAAQILENYLLQTERRVAERKALREAIEANVEKADKTDNDKAESNEAES